MSSLESENATSTEAQDFLPDDHNETNIAGIDVWNDVLNLSSSCTMEDCELDPIESVKDGMMNLEIWGTEQDDYWETAWVGRGFRGARGVRGVARRTGRRVIRRTTRRVVRRRLIWRCWFVRVRVCGWRPIVR